MSELEIVFIFKQHREHSELHLLYRHKFQVMDRVKVMFYSMFTSAILKLFFSLKSLPC